MYHSCDSALGQHKVKAWSVQNRQAKAEDGENEKKEYLIALFFTDKRPGEEQNSTIYT